MVMEKINKFDKVVCRTIGYQPEREDGLYHLLNRLLGVEADHFIG